MTAVLCPVIEVSLSTFYSVLGCWRVPLWLAQIQTLLHAVINMPKFRCHRNFCWIFLPRISCCSLSRHFTWHESSSKHPVSKARRPNLKGWLGGVFLKQKIEKLVIVQLKLLHGYSLTFLLHHRILIINSLFHKQETLRKKHQRFRGRTTSTVVFE